MSTLTLPRLTALHKCTSNLLDHADDATMRDLTSRFDRVHTDPRGYTGPDPRPVTGAILARLRARGVSVMFDSATVESSYSHRTAVSSHEGKEWGFSVPEYNSIVLRDDMTPQGTLLTLAHEAGHVLTRRVQALYLSYPYEDLLLSVYGLPASYIAGEIDAETTAYLVGQATGTGADVDVHAGYLAGYLSALKELDHHLKEVIPITTGMTEVIDEIRQRAGRHAHRCAEILLGGAA